MLAVPKLGRHLPWRELLQHLNRLPPEAHQLPLRLKCPRCGEFSLNLVDDPVTGATWHWCSCCEQRGDMLCLAAEVLQLCPEAAATQLRQEGFLQDLSLDDVQRLAAEHQIWETLRQTWSVCRQELAAGVWVNALRPLKKQGLLGGNLPAHQLSHSLHQLLGAGGCSNLERVFCPDSVVRDQPHHRYRNTSPSRIFDGSSWISAGVVGLFDLPERICGFLFLGRSGDPVKDVRHRHLTHYPGTGVALHPETWQPDPSWNGRVIALPNPWLMIRLQIKHWHHSLRPLPLVAWEPQAGSPAHVWPFLPPAVFCCSRITPVVLGQAMASGGQISLAGPRANTPAAWQEYLRHYPWPQDLMERVFRNARPWPAAVHWLARMNDSRFEELLLGCRAAGLDMQRLLEECSQFVQRRASPVLRQEPGSRRSRVLLGRREYQVRETRDGYIARTRQGHEQQIANGRLELSSVLHDVNTRTTHCLGDLLFQGQRLPIQVPLEQLEQEGFGLMRKSLLQGGVGLLKYDPRWATQLLHLALEFHQPRVEQVSSRVGFDSGCRALRLPRGNLHPSGFERYRSCPWAGRLPAETLRFPSRFSRDHASLLSRPDFPPFLWQLLVALCQQVSRTVYLGSQDPDRLLVANLGLLTSQFDQRAAPVLAELGCLDVPVWNSNRGSLQAVEGASQQHHWPLVVRGRFPSRRWPELQAGPLVAYQNSWNALCRQVEGGWHIVPAQAPETVTGPQIRALRNLFTAWLEIFAKGWFRPSERNGRGVVEQLRQALSAQSGDAANLERAAAAVQWDLGPSQPLADLLHALIRGGKLTLLPWGMRSRKPALWHRQRAGRERLLIPFADIERLLARQGAAWNRRRVARALRACGLLRATRDGCWVLPYKWWQGMLPRASQTSLLA